MARPVLLRIPFSHFCRKAEWGLTQASIEYDTLDVKLWQMKHARRANPRQGTVPVLRTDDGVLVDSHDILAWADAHRGEGAKPLFPEGIRSEVEAWEAWAGDEIAPAVRREAYRALHAHPSRGRAYGAPLYARLPFVGRRLVLAVLKHYKARRFEAADPPAIRAAIDRVAGQLTLTGTGYLLGPHATAADHAVAALLEPLALVREAYDGPGLSLVEAYVARVRPARTTRQDGRAVRERDWRALELAAR
ncbi:MAG TPA: glutathione S-transferase N-terminal domain-containing protein [Candidatus Thermoplasmatota archaeon]|nr:glutathione S-transferase N-terminal domain-containing protein [Candidatus Thermoplasmatota archaeon]